MSDARVSHSAYIVLGPACAFLCLRGWVSVRIAMDVGTLSLSRTWKNASLSVSTSPVDWYSGGKVRLVVDMGQEVMISDIRFR